MLMQAVKEIKLRKNCKTNDR